MASVNDPEREGRDVQILLDRVAEATAAGLDTAGERRVGIEGPTEGSCLQLPVACIDCLVDALVPNMAWHSLKTSLYPTRWSTRAGPASW